MLAPLVSTVTADTVFWLCALGVIAGAGIGVAAPFFPILAGASSLATAVGAIPASVAAFAATGLSMGLAGGLMLGRTAGATAAVAEESEKRAKKWVIRQTLSQNPDVKISDEPKAKPTQETFWQKTKRIYHKYVNPRVGLTMAAIGAVGGFILSAAFLATGGTGAFAIMPALATITGLTAEAAAASGVITAYTVGVGAAFGALFSFNLPRVAANLGDFFGKLIGGEIIGRKWEEPKQLAKDKTQDAHSVAENMTLPEVSFTKKIESRKPQSYEALVSSSTTEMLIRPR